MRADTLTISLSLVLTITGCTHSTLRLHQGFGIQTEARIPRPEEGRFAKSGHLLERTSAFVLSYSTFHTGVWWVLDDERCGLLIVELPDHSARLGPAIANPRAYLRRWACTWGHPQEEEAIEGTVRIVRLTNDGVRAKLALTFPSGVIKISGFFKQMPPDENMKAKEYLSGSD